MTRLRRPDQRNARSNWWRSAPPRADPRRSQSVLRGLPADFPAAVIVVQHIDAQFAPGLAKWLGEQCALPVTPAASGDIPVGGTVFLAASTIISSLNHRPGSGTRANPVEYSYRPSVNAFFESSARHWRGPMIGVLLTGHGQRWSKGLENAAQSGAPYHCAGSGHFRRLWNAQGRRGIAGGGGDSGAGQDRARTGAAVWLRQEITD